MANPTLDGNSDVRLPRNRVVLRGVQPYEMNLRWGPVPDNDAFDPESEGYVALWEPSESTFLAASIPVSFVLFVALALAWDAWWPATGCYLLSPVDLLLGIVASIVVHEWVHALTLPDQGAGENTLFGFYWRQMIFYTHYEGAIDRERFLVTLVSPFVMLSIVPLVFCAALGEPSTLLRFISILNGLGSSADILGFFLVLRGIPKNAIVRNKGWKTWWQPLERPEGQPLHQGILS